MKQVTIRKFGVGSLAKVVGFYQAVLGFVVGLFTSLATAAEVVDKNDSFIQNTGISLTILAFGVVIFPLVMFVVGWIQGAVLAIILNFAFTETGGLELHTD